MSEKTQIIITATDQTKAAFQSVQSSLAGLEKTAIGLGPIFAGLGAALTVGAFTQTIANTIKFAAALDDMAEATGASVENLSALASVARIGGHDLGLVESSLQKLAKALHGTGEESEGAAAALEALGLSADELRNKDTAEAMLDVAKALDQFKDGSGKTAVAIALLGKNGAQLLPFLKDLAEQSELVGKVTAEQAAQAEAYEKNLNRLTASFSSAGKAAAYELLPFLEKITSEMVAARDASGSFASVIGDGVRTALETVAVLGVNVAYVFKQVGNEVGGIAAQISRLAVLDFKGAGFIGDAMKEDAKRARAEVDKLSADLLDRSKKTGEVLAAKPALKFATPDEEPKKKKTGSGRAQIDEATRLIQSLDEQIAVKNADAEATDKMTASEQQAVKVRQQLEAGTLKATAAQRATIEARFTSLAALEREIAAHKEFTDALKKQEEANVKGNQAMLEQIAAAEKETELYGLTASQISVVEQARLADAIAIAKQNGASEDQIAYLEKELALRGRVSDALIAKDTKVNSIEDAKKEAAGVTDTWTEFSKQAAHNIQDAMADFFINPTKDGMESIGKSFGKMVQKMIAEAAAAQLGKLLFGDMGKTGNAGGLFGDVFGDLFKINRSVIIKDFSSLFSFANGGIMTAAGAVPLHKYARGGIANSAQLAMFGEGSTPEAYVPLPDGRRIPVQMNGGGASGLHQTLNFYGQAEPAQVKRAAASGARSVLGVVSGSQRYS
nr:hypothetical protein [Azonexus sp.]